MAEFNWQKIVKDNKPNPDSLVGQAQLEMYQKLQSSLTEWAANYNLVTTRLNESIYTGIVTTAVPTPYHEAFLLAKYILWTFNLDVFIDFFDYSRFNQKDGEDWIKYFDVQLAAVLKPLYEVGNLQSEQALSYGLNPLVTTEDGEVEAISLKLGRVLLDLYQSLEEWAYCEPPSQAGLDFVLNNFSEQIAKMIGAMRGELIQNFRYRQEHDTRELPDMDSYLKQSKLSIGLRPGAAIALGFGPVPQTAWQDCDAAMDAATKIVRLANDLSSYWSELKEHKVTSVTVALARQGANPASGYQPDSPQIHAAYTLIRGLIEQELDNYLLQTRQIPPTPLQHWLELTLAFALAMYATGNYVIPS